MPSLKLNFQLSQDTTTPDCVTISHKKEELFQNSSSSGKKSSENSQKAITTRKSNEENIHNGEST
jgi:hypothetical protein